MDVSKGEWKMGLIDLMTYHIILNVKKDISDKFYYGNNTCITLDEGAYKTVLKEKTGESLGLSLKVNNNTLKAKIK